MQTQVYFFSNIYKVKEGTLMVHEYDPFNIFTLVLLLQEGKNIIDKNQKIPSLRYVVSIANLYLIFYLYASP